MRPTHLPPVEEPSFLRTLASTTQRELGGHAFCAVLLAFTIAVWFALAFVLFD
jgi:hypothetical protein